LGCIVCGGRISACVVHAPTDDRHIPV
jgi:hypothetical protein